MNSTPSVIRTRGLAGLALGVCLCLCVVAMASGVAEAQSDGSAGRLQSRTAQQGRNLGELLRPDGSLDLKSGYRGALNPEGYRLASGPDERPRFELGAAPGDERWSDAFSPRGASGPVSALVLDGMGNLYAGGSFTTAGGVTANNIAKWDGASWSPLGSGTGGSVSALAVDGNGNLYAGGYFTTAGGIAANNIAKWDGASWSPLGSGTDYEIYALAVDANGNLYAGGSFTTAGWIAANHIAKWDGTSWSPLDSGMNTSTQYPLAGVYALAVDANGNLYAGGYFTTAGGVAANHIAKWDGTSWSVLGTGMSTSTQYPVAGVYALDADANGNLYAGGYFTTAGGVAANCIAKWDGASWSAVGNGLNAGIEALALDGHGSLYAGGSFTTAGGVVASNIAKWDGASWSALGTGDGISSVVDALVLDGSGNLYAGGSFSTAGGVIANNIAKWDGASWSPLGSGTDGLVSALAVDGSGNLYAGGRFTNAGGVVANYIAKWDGNVWAPLASGMNQPVTALAVDGNGNLYAGGWFTTAGGVTVSSVAKWDGSSWSAIGSGLIDVRALAVDGSGNLYAGSGFWVSGHIAKWDGSAWSGVGGVISLPAYPPRVGDVRALAADGSGNLYAGGAFNTAGGVATSGIAKWDGTSWSAIGNGAGTAAALAMDGNGNLYAGGWIGTADGVVANSIAKWDGSAWSPLGSGTDGWVSALAVDESGNLYAGGWFTTAGGKSSNSIAKRQAAVPPFSISGTVKANSVPLAGVTMTLSGAAKQTVTTDADGRYEFSGLGDGVYTMTPSMNEFGFSPASRTVHIRGDDVVGQDFERGNPPRVLIRATDGYASEPGKNKGRLVISRIGDTSKPLTVYYKVTGTAKSGSDYRKLPGKLIIPKGKARASFYVKPTDDSTRERKETVKVTLVKRPSYQIGKPASAMVSIVDND